MPVWDLATRANWELVLTDRRITTPISGSETVYGGYSFEAIPPIYAVCDTDTVLVGTFSQTAKPYWFLGGIVSQYLFVSPSMSTNFISGVQAGESKKAGLNRLTLLEFNNYNVHPYTLSIQTPYYIEDIYIEVWQYLAQDSTDSDDILLRLDSIEMKIDAMANHGA
jgi:hypothetical protein